MEEVLLALNSSSAASTNRAAFFVEHRDRFMEAQQCCRTLEVRMISKHDPLVATRGELAGLPVSAATLELINKAKVDLRKRPRVENGGGGGDPRVCRHCNETFQGNVFKHLNVCKKRVV